MVGILEIELVLVMRGACQTFVTASLLFTDIITFYSLFEGSVLKDLLYIVSLVRTGGCYGMLPASLPL